MKALRFLLHPADHDAMGWCEISTQRMQDMAAQPGSVVELQPPKGRSPGNYGTLQVGSRYRSLEAGNDHTTGMCCVGLLQPRLTTLSSLFRQLLRQLADNAYACSPTCNPRCCPLRWRRSPASSTTWRVGGTRFPCFSAYASSEVSLATALPRVESSSVTEPKGSVLAEGIPVDASRLQLSLTLRFPLHPPEGGTEIGFIVATDFTASNGDPNSPDSKHFFSGELRPFCSTR